MTFTPVAGQFTCMASCSKPVSVSFFLILGSCWVRFGGLLGARIFQAVNRHQPSNRTRASILYDGAFFLHPSLHAHDLSPQRHHRRDPQDRRRDSTPAHLCKTAGETVGAPRDQRMVSISENGPRKRVPSLAKRGFFQHGAVCTLLAWFVEHQPLG